MIAATRITLGLLLAVMPLTATTAADAGSQPTKATTAQAQGAGQEEGRAPGRAEGVWIDVRTEREYNQGHLEGALNVPVNRIAREIATISPDRDAPIHLYCRSGSRAEAALQLLREMGYTRVQNHGAYKDLVTRGMR